MSNNSQDEVTLVDQSGVVLGSMDKYAAHRGSGVLHLACSVFLFHFDDETKKTFLLIQQRSPVKIVGGWQWANTICGNVRPNETPGECAQRRLHEELAIPATTLTELMTWQYQTPCNAEYSENELDHIYAGWSDLVVIHPNPQEVITTEWLEWPTQVDCNDKKAWHDFLTMHDFTPWFRLFIQSDVVRTALLDFTRRRL